jgi:putative sugar O-methyltransferase
MNDGPMPNVQEIAEEADIHGDAPCGGSVLKVPASVAASGQPRPPLTAPVVTIGMPVYNGARSIRAALDSLLEQSFENFVLEISDNGSTDGTPDIIAEYAARDGRIQFTRQPRNLGPAMNFRFVLFKARTPYFMWAAADDLWAPGFVQRHLAFLESHPDFVASQSRVLFTIDGRPTHFSTGTAPLLGTFHQRAEKFLTNPADNSRYYGLFRTAALQAVFPIRSFYALDWAVSVATLRYGQHNEIADVLMVRDWSNPVVYEKAVLTEHRRLLWRVFPVLFMTKWLILKGLLPPTPGILYRLAKLNLYLHFRFGLYRFTRLAEMYLANNSLRTSMLGMLARGVHSAAEPGLGRRLRSAAGKLRRAGSGAARKVWRLMPITVECRQRIKTAVFRRGGPLVRNFESYQGWRALPGGVNDGAPAADFIALAPPALPIANWAMPLPDERPPVVSIVVVVCDGLASTLALIDSLTRAKGDLPVELIVVDRGSSDITRRVIANIPGIVLLAVPRATTFAEAANPAVARASAPAILFVEQETLLTESSLPALLRGLAQRGGMVGPQVRYGDGRLKAAGGMMGADIGPFWLGRLANPNEPRFFYARPVCFCPGGFVIAKATLAACGGFGPEFRTLEGAGMELALRMTQREVPITYWPLANIVNYSENGQPGQLDHTQSPAWREDRQLIHARLTQAAAALEERQGGTGLAPDEGKRSRLLFVDADSPTPDQNSTAIYVINLFKLLMDYGFQITFVPESNFIHRGKYTDHLNELGIETIYYPYFYTVQEVLERAETPFDLVILSRAYIAEKYTDLVRRLSPRSRIVFNTIDLHHLREARAAQLSGIPAQIAAAEQWRRVEFEAIGKADATILISSYERDLVAKELPEAKLHVIPSIFDVPARLDVPGFSERRDIMFVGTYQHPPNVDAAVFFARDIWPLVRAELPDAKFLVVGSAVTPQVLALAGGGVEVVGFVEDLDALMAQCRLAVAPLRYGAGIKGKLGSSCLVGLPAVATSIAVEGMPLVAGRDVLVADDAETFARMVVDLYRDQAAWEAMSQAGFDFVRRYLSIESAVGRVRRLLLDVGVQPSATEHDLIAAEVDDEIAQAADIYRPSDFWTMLQRRNSSQIRGARIATLKRSINNNYFNWLPGDFNDNQVRALMRFWLSRPSPVPLEVVAHSGTVTSWEEVQSFSGTNLFQRENYPSFYAFFVGLLWYFAMCNDPIRLCDRLEEPSIGFPLPVAYQGRRISQDLANSLLEWSRVHTLVEGMPRHDIPVVMELGAGYGRLAYVFAEAEPCRYIIVDIAPALAVAQWYLMKTLPQLKFFKFRHFDRYGDIAEQFESSDICFLSSNQLELLPDDLIDFSISISSLHEMRLDQIAHFKALISRKTRSAVYFKQWKQWTNPNDDITVQRSDFLLDDAWQLVLDDTHAIQNDFCELGFIRREPRSLGRDDVS